MADVRSLESCSALAGQGGRTYCVCALSSARATSRSSKPPDTSGPGTGARRTWAPLAVLLISLAVTAASTLLLARTLDARVRTQFEIATREAEERIEVRVRTYENMLRGGAALFAANGNRVDRENFRAFAQRFQVRDRYPGIQGFGFAERVSPDEVNAIEQRVHAEGFRNYEVHPHNGQPDAFPIVFLEPLDERNRAALGYDMFSEPVRRAAMDRAWRTGLPALSGRVTLRQEIEPEKQAGFLLYVPVFRRGDIPDTEAERRRELIGFVYAPFRADDFFLGIFGEDVVPRVGFRAWDGDAPRPDGLLHDTAVRGAEAHDSQLTRTVRADVSGHVWTLQFGSLPALEQSSPRALVPALALGGAMLSLLLFALTQTQASARRAAERSAEDARRSRDELEAERGRLNALFMAAPAAIALTRGPEHVWVLSNAQNTIALGGVDVVGKRVRDVFPAPDRDRILGLLDRVYQTGQPFIAHEASVHLQRPDGSPEEHFINFVYQPTRDARGDIDGVALFSFDVTAQVQSRQRVEALADELRRNRAQLEAVFQSMQDGVMVFDGEGDVIFVNDAEAHILGFESPEDMRRNFRWFAENFELCTDAGSPVPPDEWPVSRILRGETVDEIEYRARRADTGAEWHFAFSGAPVRDESGKQVLAVIITRDVTARVRAETALRESEQQFRTLADAIAQLAFKAEADGRPTWFNRRWYEYTGLGQMDRAQAEAHGWLTLVEPSERERVEESWRRAIVSGEPWEETFPLRRRDGEYRWHLTRAMPVRGASGRIVRWFGTHTDVEDERRYAAALREALHVRDIFLSVASHELKTPLTPLALRLAALKRDAGGAGEGQRPRVKLLHNLEIAEQQVRKLAALVDGLLDVSRLSEGRLSLVLEEVDLARIVRETAQAMAPQAERAGSVLDVHATGAAIGRFDRVRLGQVVTNLLSNAIKFGAGRPIELRLTATAERARLMVRDSGIGIPEDFHERIFGRFERGVSERNYGGLGLGLYVTRQIVEAMGGTISVESTPGQGATFTVDLPRAGPPEQASDEPPEATPKPPQHS